MKILSVGYALEKASGVTTFVEETAAGLRALGHEVDVVDVLKGADRTGDVGKYDVVHLHCLWQLHKYAVAARKAKVPIVWSTHGMTAPWAMRHKWLKKKIAWWMFQRRDLKSAAVIHCTTEQENKWNEALGFKNCFVAPLGTQELQLTQFQSPTPTHNSNYTLLFVGRIHPVKGLINLIRAWGLVFSSRSWSSELESGGRDSSCSQGWKLRIVGPDEAGHQFELESLVRELKLGDSVEFVGPKFGEELSREYDECDCLVLPSFTENFGATVVDAMAHGKPVITSTFAPWREVAERGCGWWVSNEPESLARAIGEMMGLRDEERAAMGAKGLGLVAEKYSWPAVAETMLNAYRSILKGKES